MSPRAPDEQIRSVLLSARYNNDEVDTALMVLRQNPRTNKTTVEGLHKVFRSDEALRPEEISQLLGIEVDASQFQPVAEVQKNYAIVQYVVIWFISVVLAVSGILFYMYVSQVGLFHPTVEPPINIKAPGDL